MQTVEKENIILSNTCILCEDHPEGRVYVNTEEIKFLKCPGCSLIWRTYPQEDITQYDNEEYFTSFYDSKTKRRINKSIKQLKLIEKFTTPEGVLLEVGCSLGYFLQAARKRGWSTVGVDVGKYAVDQCKSQGFEAYNIAAQDLKQLDKKFKAIVMRHVFEHLPDPIGQLKVLHDILEDDGLILLNLPDSRYLKARILKDKYKFYSPKNVGLQHYFYYRPDNLKRMLENSGFKVLMKNDRYHSLLSKAHISKEFITIARKVSK